MSASRHPDTASPPWMVSLHGGHSGEFCDHAEGALRDQVEAAIAAGIRILGLAEHAPRAEERFLYDEERAMGWTVQTLDDLFAAYAGRARELQAEYAGRITLLCGFETEAVPEDRYAELMPGLRARHALDYMVGSVHHVHDLIIDHRKADFERAAKISGGVEELAIDYYGAVRRMVCELAPEVVAHLDLIRRNAPDEASVSTARVRDAAFAALDAIRDAGGILDVNTGGYRKGFGRPYPAPWLVRAAHERGISFCFGDDSHRPGEVGAGIVEAAAYLRENGVDSITVLDRAGGAIVRKVISLT